MSETNNPDDLIEIRPDENIPENDDDMTIKEDIREAVKEAPGEEFSEEDFKENDDFSDDFAKIDQEENDMAIVEEIGESIVQQVETELAGSFYDEADFSAETDIDMPAHPIIEEEEEEQKPKNFFARIPWWGYMVAGVALVILSTVIVVFATKAGHGLVIRWGSRYAANHVTYEPVEPVEEIKVDDETDPDIDTTDIEVVPDDYTVVTPELTPTDPPASDENEEQQVYNLLLIGEENIGNYGARGRSDLIMIASINRKQKSVKITSVMRDCLVAIPGYADNKINAAYAIGGVALLYDTLQMNLGITIDNYMLVNFDNFEAIVDAIGGLDIDLTVEEARYLNTTNYISKPEYRTVNAGINHLNGNQVLGYCRIRNVETADRQFNDFGRTTRQRTVVAKIYESTKDLNYMGLINLTSKLMPYVTTDLNAELIENYVNMILESDRAEIETFRIPVSGSFGEMLLRDMVVTRIDLDANAKAFRDFAYGE